MIKQSQTPNSEPPNLEACCWNCQQYIRPKEFVLDGPVTSVCTIDRDHRVYGIEGELHPGDRMVKPTDRCDRFKLGKPSGLK